MAAANFEVFLTVDQNLRYQKNSKAAGVTVLVLVAPSNRLADLAPLMAKVRAALAAIQAGDYIEVSA